MERTDQRWEELFKGVAIGENEASNARRMVSDYQLTNGSPGVIADQGDVVEIKGLQKISHELSHSQGTQIRFWLHGCSMTAQREIGSKTAKL
jgi:hypothetical protein